MSSNFEKYDVVIVGTGLSGLVAADLLSDFSLKILMIDENLYPGGQYVRKIPEQLGKYRSDRFDKLKKRGFSLIESLKQKKIKMMNRTRVLGIYPDRRLMVELNEKEVKSIIYNCLLISTGARERFLPFKGWTLPGIYSTGLTQILMKSSGIIPGKQLLIGGSGLFLMAVGYEYLMNKGELLAILEQSGMMDKAKMLTQFFRQFSKFAEGGKFVTKIFSSGVPLKYRSKIVEARGNGSLQEVIVAKIDRKGRLKSGSEYTFKTNHLAVGYGFVANIELAQLAGCELFFADELGGWTVKVNDELETSQSNIFAAGEVTGIGGGLKSITEGKIAAVSILHRLEIKKSDDSLFPIKKLTRERKHHLKFARYFNSLFAIPSHLYYEVPDDTIVCRCEDVSMGDIKNAINKGFDTPDFLKIGTRAGMGNCQSRTCGPVIYDIISALTGMKHSAIRPTSVRPPVKPVSLDSLIQSD